MYVPPSAAHWLGLDNGGFNIVSQLLYGARDSLLVGFVASVVAMVIGGGVGILSGYVGGATDVVLMRITDYFLVIPDIPLMIVAAALCGQNQRNIIIIIGVIYWTSAARLIRAQVKSVRERVYVRRAQAVGASNLRILATHVIPQVVPLLIANTVLMIANAIFAETYITFLGPGNPSVISWGGMIQNALDGGAIFYRAWWAILPPGLAVTVVVLAATMAGQGMEDALNPRLDGEDIMVGGERTVRPHRWRDVAMVFQGAMNAFNPVKTIAAQIAEPMRLHGTLPASAARARVGELLELVGIRPPGPHPATRTSSPAACASGPRSRWP